jgi:hypothetical protein
MIMQNSKHEFELELIADPLALLYNDQSVAENRSLSLAFSLFMAEPMRDFRKVLFSPTHYTMLSDTQDESVIYKYFRKLVCINFSHGLLVHGIFITNV